MKFKFEEKKANKQLFEELCQGDVFLDEEGAPLMKLRDMYVGSGCFNCVYLADGAPEYCDQNQFVEKLEAEVTLSRK